METLTVNNIKHGNKTDTMRFLNIIYYCSWQFWRVAGGYLDKFLHVVITKPLRWLLLKKIPIARKRYIKQYGSIENAEKEIQKAYDYVMDNEEWGYNTQFAMGFYAGSISFYFWGFYFVLAHYFNGMIDFFVNNKILCVLCFVAIAMCITHIATFKKNKYKKYFKEFDKARGVKRFLYKLLTFCFVIGSFLFWFWSLEFGHS
jgi:hypothetical protein